MELRAKGKADISAGALELANFFGRAIKSPGCNKDCVAYAKNALGQNEIPNDLFRLGDGARRGGVSVMVSLGMC